MKIPTHIVSQGHTATLTQNVRIIRLKHIYTQNPQGHTATVNEVDFHPTEPIIGSCSSDKKIYLGEIKAF